MFGFIICNKSGLEKAELARYQNVYCGLCRALKERYGQLGRMSLSYDMTFVALLLSSLYEPREQTEVFRCSVHPMQKKTAARNPYITYAADMTILLSYFKCLDDWQDEKKKSSKHFADGMEKYVKEIEKQYPRQWSSVSGSILELNRIEKDREAKADDAINCNGRMLSELFVCREDFWSGTLRVFGYELGKFIYLMDASIDYKKDCKTGNYNPLLKIGRKPEEMEEPLTQMIGNAARAFEKLPLVQDEHLLRNIIYGGVWQQYYAKIAGKEKQNGERPV